MADAVRVKGLRELQRALKQADKETRLGVRAELRNVAEPVRQEAAQLAGSQIRRNTPAWAAMRTGVTQKSVYVAPKQRGTKNPRSKRKNLAGLLAARALEPALDRHESETVHRFERMLDNVADRFN